MTQLLEAISEGREDGYTELIPLIYEELRAIAHSNLSRLKPGETIQTTALVHEAYLRLVRRDQEWDGRSHFFGAAARAMRDILIEEARRRGRLKRGGHRNRVPLEEDLAPTPDLPILDLVALDEALQELEKLSSIQHEVVMLRFFAGLTLDEVAVALEVAESTVDRHWSFARAWLLRTMTRGPTS